MVWALRKVPLLELHANCHHSASGFFFFFLPPSPPSSRQKLRERRKLSPPPPPPPPPLHLSPSLPPPPPPSLPFSPPPPPKARFLHNSTAAPIGGRDRLAKVKDVLSRSRGHKENCAMHCKCYALASWRPNIFQSFGSANEGRKKCQLLLQSGLLALHYDESNGKNDCSSQRFSTFLARGPFQDPPGASFILATPPCPPDQPCSATIFLLYVLAELVFYWYISSPMSLSRPALATTPHGLRTSVYSLISVHKDFWKNWTVFVVWNHTTQWVHASTGSEWRKQQHGNNTTKSCMYTYTHVIRNICIVMQFA